VTLLGAAALAACLAVGARAAADAYPLEVVDGLGERVTIREAPRRIASLTLMTDEILFDMIGPGRLVAVTTMADDPGISSIAGRVGRGPARLALNVERLVALAPDLVFLASWSDADSVRQLRDAGLAVYRVGSPRSIAEVERTIAEIGGVVGAPARALAIVRGMEERLARVSARVTGLGPAQRLRVLDYDLSGSSFAAGSSWDDIVRRAGCINAADGLPTDAWGEARLSQEKLIELDPDIVVLPGWRWEDPQGARRAYEAFVRDPAFRVLKAVRAGRVLLADERHRLSTSQYIVGAVEDLAKFAYPQLFR
jgi:iron complex transport system substrate-binding protein